MTQGTWKLVSPVILIQQLLESAGQVCHGPVILKRTKLSQKHLTIDITLTVSCARNSDTGQIMVASPIPSLDKPSSPSTSSKTSNQNTSRHFLRIYRGKDGWIINFVDMVTLLASLGVNAGSSDGEMILLSFEKPSLTIHKEA